LQVLESPGKKHFNVCMNPGLAVTFTYINRFSLLLVDDSYVVLLSSESEHNGRSPVVDEARTVVRVSAFCTIECFGTGAWVAKRKSGP